MATTDARPIPRKNLAYRVYFPITDNDGDLVTGAAGLDSEISKDGAAFTDCASEATEIGASGMYYLELTNTEMNADAVCIIIKTTTPDAKTAPIVMYPEEVGDIRVDTDAVADGILDRTAGIETGYTLRQAMRIMFSALAGKASGLNTTTALYRDVLDTKVRIQATVDADGNRSSVTLTGT